MYPSLLEQNLDRNKERWLIQGLKRPSRFVFIDSLTDDTIIGYCDFIDELMIDIDILIQQTLITQYKTSLRGWKEIIVRLHSCMIWSQPHDCPVIVLSVSLVFVLVWLLNASVLTTLSVIGFVITVSDYAVPIVCSNFVDPSLWTEREDKVYDTVCEELATLTFLLMSMYNQWRQMKETKPKQYSFVLLTSLLMLAYIGNTINNLLLLYLVTMSIVLLPGLKHHGILQQIIKQAIQGVKGVTAKVTAAATTAKSKTH